MNKTTLSVTLAILAIGGGAAWYFGKPGAEAPGGAQQRGGWKRGDGRPAPVQVAAVKNGDIDVVINAIGTVTARNTATVKARVDGLLTRIAMREGQFVKEGDVLAEIDARPYQVLLDQAKGQLLRDQAQLDMARLDLARYKDLLAKDSIARQQAEAQEALVRQYEGTVAADRAQVDNARLNLDFTRIAAPAAGRLGLRLVDVGNMVRASDATGIAVITRTQPIDVVFAIPADSLGSVLEHMRGKTPLAVEAFDRDGKTRLAAGKLLTVDNQIDVATGTVKLKAEFANADNRLFPNQFVNARLRVETRRGATLMPTAAVQRGTQGTFVYVVGEDKSVAMRTVALGPVNGDIVAVEKGVAAGERVVIDGADKLRDGGKAEIATPGAPAAKGPHGPGAGGGGNWQNLSPEERQKRWAETNARIDRGEFGEEIKKLPEEERKQRMREMRRGQQGGGAQ